VTTYQRPPDDPGNRKAEKPRHDVAVWAGAASFFGSLLAISAIDIFETQGIVDFAWSLLVAAITAGAVYSKERLTAAKKAERTRHGDST
jgi:hypothetical protein